MSSASGAATSSDDAANAQDAFVPTALLSDPFTRPVHDSPPDPPHPFSFSAMSPSLDSTDLFSSIASSLSPPRSSPSHPTAIDYAQHDQHKQHRSRRRRLFLKLLLIPTRLAIGAISFMVGSQLPSFLSIGDAVLFSSSSSSSPSPSPSPPPSVPSKGLLHLLHLPLYGWASGIVVSVASQYVLSVALRRVQGDVKDLPREWRRLQKEQSEHDEYRRRGEANLRMHWMEAIQAVGKIIDRFGKGMGKADSFQSIRNIYLDISILRLVHLAALNRRLALCHGQRQQPRSRPASASATDTLARGRHFLDYAIASYGFLLLKLTGVLHTQYNPAVQGSRGEDVVKYVLGIMDDDDILVSYLDGEEINIPRHFIALDHTAGGTIVISIRGTNSISDIITDLICSNEPFVDGYAHTGMKKAAEILYSSMLTDLLRTAKRLPHYAIVVTGHSLGAGVAILLTKLLLMNPLLTMGHRVVKCYAFAPCPVFGPMHKVDSKWSEALECFVHSDDLIATLCLASARNLTLEIETIDKKLQLTNAQKRDIINTNNVEKIETLIQRHNEQSTSNSDDLLKDNDYDQLFIPCHRGVHWLIPNSSSTTTTTSSSSSTTREAPVGNGAGDNEHLREYNERFGKDALKERRKKWKAKVKDLQNVVPPAYVPSQDYSSRVVRVRSYEKILITPNCVNNHFPNMYTSAFAGLDLPPRLRPLPPKPKKYNPNPWPSPTDPTELG